MCTIFSWKPERERPLRSRASLWVDNTGSSRRNGGIIKTCHSKTVKYIEMIQVLNC
jgi:hypothetical protein